MTKVIYEVVEHDGGWAYRANDVYSETYPTHDTARAAAEGAARKQNVAGQTTGIRYEDRNGEWHEEVANGSDRPETQVVG